jgi:hypothetical protein
MGKKLIAYQCTAPSHPPSLLHADKLTVHQRGWAFCPFDARADGHRWTDTGGEDLDTILRRAGLGIAPSAGIDALMR